MKAALTLTLLFLGCAMDSTSGSPGSSTTAAQPATIGATVEVRTIASGGYAAVHPEKPLAVAARSADEYAARWSETIGGAPRPPVDFASESVVILMAGTRSTGGFSVEVRGAQLQGRILVVDAGIKSPPRDSMVTMALTSPYAVIAVKTKDFDSVRWTP